MLLALSGAITLHSATAHEQKLSVLTILSQSEESFAGLEPIRSEWVSAIKRWQISLIRGEGCV